MANIGVHGKPATLHLEQLWIRNVTITTGLVDTATTPTLLQLLKGGRLDTSALVTHRFGFDGVVHPPLESGRQRRRDGEAPSLCSATRGRGRSNRSAVGA